MSTKSDGSSHRLKSFLGDHGWFPKEEEVIIHQLPWPVLDPGFVNVTGDMAAIPEVSREGWGAAFNAVLPSDLEWSIPCTPDHPGWVLSPFYIYRSGPDESRPDFEKWKKDNKDLLRRLEPTGDIFRWSLYWTIKAIAGGKARELKTEHWRACAIDLAHLAGVNLTPGYAGAPDVDAWFAKGALHIKVPPQMVGRWVGKGGKNIQAIQKAFGYPVKVVPGPREEPTKDEIVITAFDLNEWKTRGFPVPPIFHRSIVAWMGRERSRFSMQDEKDVTPPDEFGRFQIRNMWGVRKFRIGKNGRELMRQMLTGEVVEEKHYLIPIEFFEGEEGDRTFKSIQSLD